MHLILSYMWVPQLSMHLCEQCDRNSFLCKVWIIWDDEFPHTHCRWGWVSHSTPGLAPLWQTAEWILDFYLDSSLVEEAFLSLKSMIVLQPLISFIWSYVQACDVDSISGFLNISLGYRPSDISSLNLRTARLPSEVLALSETQLLSMLENSPVRNNPWHVWEMVMLLLCWTIHQIRFTLLFLRLRDL